MKSIDCDEIAMSCADGGTVSRWAPSGELYEGRSLEIIFHQRCFLLANFGPDLLAQVVTADRLGWLPILGGVLGGPF